MRNERETLEAFIARKWRERKGSSDGRRRVGVGIAPRSTFDVAQVFDLDARVQDAKVDLDTERGLSKGLQERVSEILLEDEGKVERSHVPSNGVDKVERDEVVARLVEPVGRVPLLPHPPDSVEVRVCAKR